MCFQNRSRRLLTNFTVSCQDIRAMHLPSHDGLTFVNSMGKEVWEMVCDESFKHRKSISALMSMSEDPIVGTNIVPGRGKDQSASGKWVAF